MMEKPMRLRLPVLVFVLAVSRAVAAQPEASASGLKMAQDLVQEGRALGEKGRWGEALERFRKAQGVSPKPTPQLTFYVGFAEARVGKLVAADVDLRRAIELAHAAGNDQVAKAAQTELPELEARTPALTIVVDGAAPPTGLQIDGETLGVAALGSPVPLDPGDHTLVVRFAGGPVTKQITLVERQHATITLDAPPAPEGAMAPPVQGTTTPATPLPPSPESPARPGPGTGDGGSGRTVLSLVVTGVGGAALVTSGVFYLLARSAISPVTSACPSSPCVAPAGSPLPSDYHDAQTKQTVSIVLAAAGGAVAATGLVLLATGGAGTAHTASGSNLQLAPWLGTSGGGASLGGRF
jgi:hypothetical protein